MYEPQLCLQQSNYFPQCFHVYKRWYFTKLCIVGYDKLKLIQWKWYGTMLYHNEVHNII